MTTSQTSLEVNETKDESTAIEENSSHLSSLPSVLNKYIKQSLKGKTILLANSDLQKEFKSSENCEVVYLTLEALAELEISLMKYHNVVTHNFDPSNEHINSIKERCVKSKVRFIAFKDA